MPIPKDVVSLTLVDKHACGCLLKLCSFKLCFKLPLCNLSNKVQIAIL